LVRELKNFGYGLRAAGPCNGVRFVRSEPFIAGILSQDVFSKSDFPREQNGFEPLKVFQLAH